MNLKPGWLERQLSKASKTVKSWQKWKQDWLKNKDNLQNKQGERRP